MSDIRKYGSNNESVDLKSADAQKKDSSAGISAMSGDVKKMKMLSNGGSAVKKKRTPIVADIIAGLLIALIAIVIVVGTVYLFRYQSNDYGNIEIEYKMIVSCTEEFTYYRPIKNKSIYLDEDNNSVYFGKVTDAEFKTDSDGNNVVILTVSADVKYRKNDGYTIGDNRVAVGGRYTVRAEEIIANGVIIELNSAPVVGGE